ncbi:Nitroreductase [Bacteroidales bacterium KHT7]|nr:Nitroreductase [Bacteroidales bacterium KHT7]
MVVRIRKYLLNLWLFINDYIYLIRSLSNHYNKSNLERQILLLSHALEKGMTFKEKKTGWGKEKCMTLCNYTEQYLTNNAILSDVLIYSINIINNYKNDPKASKDSVLLSRISGITNKYKNVICCTPSVKIVEKPHLFENEAILDFFNSRYSVRNFSDKEVTNEEIQQAVSFAKCTPTACNRQSSRVYVFKNKETINKILDNQLGNQGWCDKAGAIVVLTGVQSYFSGGYERNQVFIDGGLFAMNLVYGFHLQHIATCFKMYVRSPKLDENFRNICGIPGNEQPIVLILCGHYCEEVTLSTASKRFNTPLQVDGESIM